MEKRETDLLKKDVGNLIEKALKNHVFTACSVGFLVNNEQDNFRNVLDHGFVKGDHSCFPVNRETIFDLASLTKPLVTSLCFLALIQEKKLCVTNTLDTFLAKVPVDKKSITLLQLLTHSSGFPAHVPYYKQLVGLPSCKRMDMLISWILAEKLVFNPGAAHLYSDLGFILLGRIIEIVSGDSLDEYWNKKIIQPLDFLGLEKSLFFPAKQKSSTAVYAETGVCQWSKKRLSGLVHDDNCRALGGVAGHAGLFGNADALLSLCEILLLQFRGEFTHLSYCIKNIKEQLDLKKGAWAFGFDTPAAGISSSGQYFSEMTIGHLGFTGTSFWIDLQRGIAIVLLTNRVACGETTTSIKKLRPLLHDLIMRYLIKKSE
jgi:CubicO group peptidase (beta-lactamase class C family)